MANEAHSGSPKPAAAFLSLAGGVAIISRLFEQRGSPVSQKQAEQIFDEYIRPHAVHGGWIETAALRGAAEGGADIDHAAEAIAEILELAGVLAP